MHRGAAEHCMLYLQDLSLPQHEQMFVPTLPVLLLLPLHEPLLLTNGPFSCRRPHSLLVLACASTICSTLCA